MLWTFVLALLLFILSWLSIRRARALRHESGLPAGRLIYADSSDREWQISSNPLYSVSYSLVGKPDYLVHTPKGIIPVEVKSANAPDIPYVGHLLQLAAYCLLVEETTGHTPPHGLLKYADALYEIDFTPELRHELLGTLTAIRQLRPAEKVNRSHNQPNKCAKCGFRNVCDEALVS